MNDFTVYPAIDLRGGQVVRLKQGDPGRQTVYGEDAAATARGWLEAGARWLHVVNLDGAFGQGGEANGLALRGIVAAAAEYDARVQLGGGMRSLFDLENAFSAGVARVVLGTLIVEAPRVVRAALGRFGPQRVAAGLDARQGRVHTRGWRTKTGWQVLDLAQQWKSWGGQWLVYTDIARDGVAAGVAVSAARELAAASGLAVIASGGVASLEDVRAVKEAGLPGVIVGRALYEGAFTLQEALQC